MGTRSLTHVKDRHDNTLVTIYRQFDGYPSGMGADIQKALNGPLVNGISDDDCFNGMGCAAAALIKSIKDGPGNVYVYQPDACEVGEEYVYIVTPSTPDLLGFDQNASFNLKIYEGPMTAFGHGGDQIENLKPIYDGPLQAMDPEKLQGEDE